MPTQLGDVHYITTFDGKTLHMFDSDVRLILYGNYGAPPTTFQTRRGYLQDGETEIGFLLGPRHVSVQLFREPTCNRQTYWDHRKELHDFLRPNRNGPMVFTLIRPDGSRRSLTVRGNPGLEFPIEPPDENSWVVKAPLEFVAYDPLWFDPSQHSSVLVGTVDTDLVFPITFDASHIVFGVSGVVSKTTVNYQGTWITYPIITITGPYTTVNIQNLSTGVLISLNVAISAGDKRILDLTPGQQTVKDGSGNNKFGDLGPNSNLVDFDIRPNPMVANGVNVIQSQFIGGTLGQNFMTLSYYDRYFAL